MQPIRIVLDDAPQNLPIPKILHHQRVEVVLCPLEPKKISLHLTEKDIESACGILQASHSVSLEQMDEVIRKRGGHL